MLLYRLLGWMRTRWPVAVGLSLIAVHIGSNVPRVLQMQRDYAETGTYERTPNPFAWGTLLGLALLIGHVVVRIGARLQKKDRVGSTGHRNA